MSLSFGLIDHDSPLAAAADRPDWSRGFSRDDDGNFSSHAHIREFTTTEVVGAAIAAAALAGGAYIAVRVRQRLQLRKEQSEAEAKAKAKAKAKAEAEAEAGVIPFRPRAQSLDVA